MNGVTKIYDELGIRELTEDKINAYFDNAFDALNRVDAPIIRKGKLKKFVKQLIDRES